MLVSPVKARLEAKVPVLAHRVEGAAELSALTESGELPQAMPCAFVYPAGMRPLGDADASTGAFLQLYREVVGIALFCTAAGDTTGERALVEIDDLIGQVLPALAGWAPSDQVGVFQLESGNLLGLRNGFVAYALEFAVTDQLRVLS